MNNKDPVNVHGGHSWKIGEERNNKNTDVDYTVDILRFY